MILKRNKMEVEVGYNLLFWITMLVFFIVNITIVFGLGMSLISYWIDKKDGSNVLLWIGFLILAILFYINNMQSEIIVDKKIVLIDNNYKLITKVVSVSSGKRDRLVIENEYVDTNNGNIYSISQQSLSRKEGCKEYNTYLTRNIKKLDLFVVKFYAVRSNDIIVDCITMDK